MAGNNETHLGPTNYSLSFPDPPCNVSRYDEAMYYPWDMRTTFQEPWSQDTAFWPTAITYGITFITGIIGNVLVVFALVLDRKARNVTSFFLISLAVADIAYLLICAPYEALFKLNSTWTGGAVLCKLYGFVEMLSASASVINLMAVSTERYIVIVHPMKSRSWCTIGNTKKIIVAVWIVATVLSAPHLHVMTTKLTLYYNNASCVETYACMDYNLEGLEMWRLVFAYYQLAVMFVVPVLVMLFCYSVVIHVLWSSTKELARMTNTTQSVCSNCGDEGIQQRLQGSDKLHNRPVKSFLPRAVKDHGAEIREARKQVIKMLLVIIVAFFLCWGPKLVMHTMKRHELSILYSDLAFNTTLVINLLPFIHSCLNPIIYSFMSNNFRRSMRTGCRKLCCCKGIRRIWTRRPRSLEFDMDNSKGINGLSKYSPTSTNSRCLAKTTYSMLSAD